MNKKKPMKNYVILGLIYCIVILLVFYFVRWYQAYQSYQNEIPVIRGVLQELGTDEIDHYLQEEPNALLYLCTAEEEKCRTFESQFRYDIKKKGFASTMVYVNLSQEENSQAYLQSFLEKYGTYVEGDSYPILVQFEDGKIKDYQANLTVSLGEKFLNQRGIA